MRLGGEPRLVLDRETDGDPSHDVSLSIASTVRRVKTHRLRLHRDARIPSAERLADTLLPRAKIGVVRVPNFRVSTANPRQRASQTKRYGSKAAQKSGAAPVWKMFLPHGFERRHERVFVLLPRHSNLLERVRNRSSIPDVRQVSPGSRAPGRAQKRQVHPVHAPVRADRLHRGRRSKRVARRESCPHDLEA